MGQKHQINDVRVRSVSPPTSDIRLIVRYGSDGPGANKARNNSREHTRQYGLAWRASSWIRCGAQVSSKFQNGDSVRWRPVS